MSVTNIRSIGILALFCASVLSAQPVSITGVPLIRISGSLRAGAAVESVTFNVYSEPAGGTPLWQETQNVALDREGRYSAVLGAMHEEGLPQGLFSSGQARWLGVQVDNSRDGSQPRVLLSVATAGPAPSTASFTAEPTDPVMRVRSAPRFASGTMNTIALFTDNAGDLGNSVLYQNAGKIGLGTLTPLDYFSVAFTDTTGVFTGYAVQNLGSGASSYSGMLFYDQNGSLGQFQGFNNSTHEYRINNIASNGSINFMLAGNSKFQVRPDGDINIAGSIRKGGSLFLHNVGTQNLGAGSSALTSNTGSGNTGVGYQALVANTTGNNNTAIGVNAGSNLTTGSNDIEIGNSGGAANESNTIRIGSTQTRAFIAGVNGVTTGANNAIPVMVDSNGQLGTVSSSRRFKTDIADMGDSSSDIFKLRPVTFHYKQHPADRLEYGLIAEEVAEVYPDLVVNDADGQVQTVQYYKLTPMLLNELQKERAETQQKLQERNEALQQQKEMNQKFRERIAALEALLNK